MEQNSIERPAADKDSLWYLDNYILLKDYYDRTISRIAARCVRMGNIAIEEYPFYSYILDVLEEISETGEYVFKHKELYPYVEKKIPGGMEAFKKSLREYKQELSENAAPEMIKDNIKGDAFRMKAAFSKDDKAADPTLGAGMSMDQLMEKLTKGNQAAESKLHDEKAGVVQAPQEQPEPEPVQEPIPQPVQEQELEPEPVQEPAQEQKTSEAAAQPEPQVQAEPEAEPQPQPQAQPSTQEAPKTLIKVKKAVAAGSMGAVPSKPEASE